jgi:hypothetical protein
MAVGAAQALAFGPAATLLLALQQSRGADFADRAARGLGKVVWRRRLAFYGAAEVARSEA